MHIVALGWMFVVLLWALAEASAPHGTLLGAFFTLLLYGALPLAIVLYVMGSPMRRRARRAAEAAGSGLEGDAGGHAAGEAVTPEGKEP